MQTKMTFYLFAKFYRHLSAGSLMELCRELGIDGPTALIREGYWTAPENLEADLAEFVKCARSFGFETPYADTPYSPFDKDADRTFGILSGNGIKSARLAYIAKNSTADARSLHDTARRYAEAAAKLGERHSVRAVIQLHGGMYPHNATAAYPVVSGLDPKYIGIKIDPGNNLQQEGYELFDYQINLLREYIAAVGAKSGAMVRRQPYSGGCNGWQRINVPAQDGAADYKQIYRCLNDIGFGGPSVLMPFYDSEDPVLMTEGLRGEIKYLKECAGQNG